MRKTLLPYQLPSTSGREERREGGGGGGEEKKGRRRKGGEEREEKKGRRRKGGGVGRAETDVIVSTDRSVLAQLYSLKAIYLFAMNGSMLSVFTGSTWSR